MKYFYCTLGFVLLVFNSILAQEKNIFIVESRHFAITWNHEIDKTLEKNYTQQILDELEKAWDFFAQLGFKKPIYASRIPGEPIELYPKIIITLIKNIPDNRSSPSLGNHTYDVLSFSFWEKAFDIEIPLNLSQEQIKQAAALVLFHCIQYSYDAEEDLWLYHATAKWAEALYTQKITDKDIESMNAFLSSFQCQSLDHNLGVAPGEGRELFFHYLQDTLTERGGLQKNLIERIWFFAGEKKGANSIEALAQALGEENILGDKVKNIFTDFSLTNVLLDHKIFHHKDALKTKLEIPQAVDLNKIYRENFKDEVFAFSFDMNSLPSLHSIYLSVTPPKTLKEKEKFYLKIETKALNEWTTAVVAQNKEGKTLDIFATHGKAQDKIETKGNGYFLTLNDFGPEGIEKIIIILNHITPPVENNSTNKKDTEGVQVIFSIGDPPILENVQFIQGDNEIYSAELKEKSKEERQLLISKDEILDLKKDRDQAKINLKFSKKLLAAPKAFLEEFEIQGLKTTDEGKSWEATVDLERLKKSLQEPWPADLNLIVSAQSSALLSLDPLPQTIARIGDEFATTKGEETKILWINYEGEEKQKKDKIHRIKLSKNKIIVRGQVFESKGSDKKPISNATVLVFVDYWTAPKEKIDEKLKLWKEMVGSAQKGQKTFGKEQMEKLKSMYVLDLGLKEWGKHYSGGDTTWITKTDEEGKFLFKDMPPYDLKKMYDLSYDIAVFRDGYIGGSGGVEALGQGGGYVQLMGQNETVFEVHLSPSPSCKWQWEDSFSGTEFRRAGDFDTKYMLFKQGIDTDEIILPFDSPKVELPADQKKEKMSGDQKLVKEYEMKIQKIKSLIRGIDIVEVHPIRLPMDGKQYDMELTVGYKLSKVLNNYRLLKQHCVFNPIPPPQPPYDQEANGFEVGVPYMSSWRFFEDIEENIKGMEQWQK